MPSLIACAIVREDPPQVFLAQDMDTLSWVLALQLIARTPGRELAPSVRRELRDALREERWADAVELWMSDHPEVDVYPSLELYAPRDVEFGAHELEFTPLFED